MQVDFYKPYLSGQEGDLISQALNAKELSGGNQHTYVKLCESWLESTLNVKKAFLTTSCTDALEMSALLLSIQPGDEVIVPSFTFVSTVNAFVMHGAKPVFVDIREDTLNIDESKIESVITKNTKAIVPVHYGGHACEMSWINHIAEQHGLAVIEDNAQGFMGKYDGKPLGSLSALAALSFHQTKNVTCGEGGALLINDESLIGRAEILLEKGTNRAQYSKGMVNRYTWVDIGSSFLQSNLLAAVLYAQFNSISRIQSRRSELWWNYHNALSRWAEANHISLPPSSASIEEAYHLFFIVCPSKEARISLQAHLKEKGIMTAGHFTPLHKTKMARRFSNNHIDCPVTEAVSEQILRLPLYVDLSDAEQQYIIDSVTRWEQ